MNVLIAYSIGVLSWSAMSDGDRLAAVGGWTGTQMVQADSDTRRRDFEIDPDAQDGGTADQPSEDETQDGSQADRSPPPDVINPDEQAPGCRMRDGRPLELLV